MVGTLRVLVRNRAGEESAPPTPRVLLGAPAMHSLLSLTSISSSSRSPQTASSPGRPDVGIRLSVDTPLSQHLQGARCPRSLRKP